MKGAFISSSAPSRAMNEARPRIAKNAWRRGRRSKLAVDQVWRTKLASIDEPMTAELV
jgi:hypothetical protein